MTNFGLKATRQYNLCLVILQEIKELSQSSKEYSPIKLLNIGLGLAQGSFIESNMSPEFKKDFTIIGDSVNTASRLEGLTRVVNSSIVISKELM